MNNLDVLGLTSMTTKELREPFNLMPMMGDNITIIRQCRLGSCRIGRIGEDGNAISFGHQLS
jgi:hypothetical protein